VGTHLPALAKRSIKSQPTVQKFQDQRRSLFGTDRT
jgi:hypothetical protein